MTEVLSFDEAIKEVEGTAHVLLGNGFSIACRHDCFTYGALLDEAEFSAASTDLRQIFEILGTTDFEKVIALLRAAASICDAYGVDPSFATRLRADADLVRDALARVLASRHPEYPAEIELGEFKAARQFLSHFDRIYTLSYDMLLYWAVMQTAIAPVVSRNDGFSESEEDDAPYVAWSPYAKFQSQRVFYLHGGLHLYDRGSELAKFTWSRTGVRLVDQIREALEEGRYPLIVTEGTSDEKLTKILHSAYLNHAIRSFSAIGGTLFVYGLSLSENDYHLVRRIEDGSIKALYVSLYGEPENPDNVAIRQRASAVATRRPAEKPLSVRFYDAESAHVWG